MRDSAYYIREISAVIDRFAPADGEFATLVGNLFLSRRTTPTLPFYTAQWPCLALVAQGAKRLVLAETVHDYRAGDYLVVSLDVPVASYVTEATPDAPLLGLGIAIDGTLLRELLERTGLPLPAERTKSRGVAVHTAPVALLDAILRLLQLLDRPHDIPALACLIEQEILYRLLMGPQGATLVQIATVDSPGNRIARAIAWLKENYAAPLRIEELAQFVGMSTSSLHHHFSAIAGLTPMQYQKQLRLHEARRLMLVEHLDVGSAGFQVGYQSPSQFSREYSRLYGVSPMRHVEQLRLAHAGENAPGGR